MMRAVIRYKRIVDDDGKKKIMITGWEGVLKSNEIPKMYFSADQYFYQFTEGDLEILVNEKGKHTYLYVGSKFEVEKFSDIISTMKKAGANLTRIKKELQKRKSRWNGEGAVEI